jgi:hypothetical protein
MWEMNGTSIIGGGALPNSGSSWHVIGSSDFNGDGKADILWQSTDGLPVIWEMNGTSIIGSAALPNPGPTWHPKDDGPIPLDQMTSDATQQPALHLSAPDGSNNAPAANNSVAGVNNTFAGASLAMPPNGSGSGSPGPFGLSLGPPAGVSPQFAAVWTSLLDSPAVESFQKLFTGGA